MELANNKAEAPLAHYRALLAASDPLELAKKRGFMYSSSKQEFAVRVLGHTFTLSWPEGTASTFPVSTPTQTDDSNEPDALTSPTRAAYTSNMTAAGFRTSVLQPEISSELTILLLRIVLETSVTPSKGGFIAFSQIPFGSTYMPAFNRRCIFRLAKLFATAEQLEKACQALGGTPCADKADIAYSFEFMPNITLKVLFWEADDEFPAQAQLLFSDNIAQAFSSEDVVVISEILIRALEQGYIS